MSTQNPADDAPRSFMTTRWSEVLAASQRSSPVGEKALAELCERYWFPLYAFVRRRVGDEHQARDLTQEFFARLLEKNILAAAQPERGRFRAFLLTAARNFLVNEGEKARAEKRGGGRATLPLDFAWGEARYHREPVDPWTAEKLYDRQWTLLLLDQVFVGLRRSYDAQGKSELFERLKVYLVGQAGAPSYAETGRALAMREGAVKVAVHRLRERYREMLRAEVALTVADDADVDEEIRQLFRSLESA
jgi:RNA polymerase sigma-70 factor (ECF subfamily)